MLEVGMGKRTDFWVGAFVLVFLAVTAFASLRFMLWTW
jgi:hypothetical protein